MGVTHRETIEAPKVVRGGRFEKTGSTAYAEVTTAGAATYTAAQLLAGIIYRDCAGAGRTDVLPTAALLVAAMTEPRVGDVVSFLLCNGSDAAETITVSEGTGGTWPTYQLAATRTVVQNASRMVYLRITGVGSSAAYTVTM